MCMTMILCLIPLIHQSRVKTVINMFPAADRFINSQLYSVQERREKEGEERRLQKVSYKSKAFDGRLYKIMYLIILKHHRRWLEENIFGAVYKGIKSEGLYILFGIYLIFQKICFIL